MAGSFNRITIVGNLGRDPEMRYLPSGDPVASFSVATTERWRTRDGQQQERTTWFNVSASLPKALMRNHVVRSGCCWPSCVRPGSVVATLKLATGSPLGK